MIICIHIPHTKINIIQYDLVSFYIIWEIFFGWLDDLALHIFKDQLCHRILYLECTSESGSVNTICTSVNNDQLRLCELFHQHISHIHQIHIQCCTIYGRVYSLKFETSRVSDWKQILQLPHSIVLNDNLCRMIVSFTVFEKYSVQLVKFFDFQNCHIFFF